MVEMSSKEKTSGPKFPIWGTMVDSRSCLSLSLLRFLGASHVNMVYLARYGICLTNMAAN